MNLVLAVVLAGVYGCGDGEAESAPPWTDPASGLTWQGSPTGGELNGSDAAAHCQSLTLEGLTGWRLPDIDELRSLIRGCPATQPGGACGVTTKCLASSCYSPTACQTCAKGAGPVGGCYWPDQLKGPCGYYWSSSVRSDLTTFHWVVTFEFGALISRGSKTGLVRCVRK